MLAVGVNLKQRLLTELLGGETVSGAALAQDSSVSRMAISKAVGALRTAGFGIESRTGVGYRLTSLSQMLSADEVAARLASDYWQTVSGEQVVTSTNTLAMDAGRSGVAGPSVFVAAEQTQGRGRLGRTWESPVGGLYVSVLLRPNVPVSELGSLSLVTALAVAESAERFTGKLGTEVFSVKWPNDVLVDQQKLAGILLESQASTDGIDFVVIGIGVNVQPVQIPGATALGMARPAEYAAVLLDTLAEYISQWETAGFAPFVDSFAKREVNTSQQVAVRDRTGALIAEGIVTGVSRQGELLLTQPDGLTAAVATGEVTLRS